MASWLGTAGTELAHHPRQPFGPVTGSKGATRAG